MSKSGLSEVRPAAVPGKYEVLGSDMQILNLEVPSGDNQPKLVATPRSMNYADPSMRMSTDCGSCFGRCMSGETCIMASYRNSGDSPVYLGLTPNFPAKIVPLEVSSQAGKTWRMKNGAFFASQGDVNVSFNFDCNPMTCCFGGQGCVRQVVNGEGDAFIAAMGTLMTKELAAGEKMLVSTDSLFAWSSTAKIDVRLTGGCCTCCCAGEGMFNTVLNGPGTIYVQSMSIEKFKKALTVYANSAGGKKGGSGGDEGAPPEGEEMER
jgi:uncharacterized protein (AIM24 family)